MKRGRPKKSWDEVVKRGLCINDAQDKDKWRQCCRRVVDPAIKEERSRRRRYLHAVVKLAMAEGI